jgi:hypothetical protein
MPFELIAVVVVVALDGGVLDRAVHPLDLVHGREGRCAAEKLAAEKLDTRINWLSNVALRGVKAVSALSRA